MSVTDDRFVIAHHPNFDWTKPVSVDSADSTDTAGPTEDPPS